MRPTPASLLALLVACSGATLPDPTIRSVDPTQRAASGSGPVTVSVDAVLPTVVDYGAESAIVDDRLSLRIGPRAFGPDRWVDGGVVTDFLPSLLPEGTYDVTVQLGDGRTATASNAFTVTLGSWPTGYTVDSIPAEKSGVAFGVTLRAVGPNSPSFVGTVNLEVPGATVTPTVSGPFEAGVRVETITVTGHGMRQLLITDLASHTGVSAPFMVR
jgi:hypothetical protein